MKRKTNRKVAVSIIAMLVFCLALSAVVFADGAYKDLRAWFGNLSIYKNNQYVELSDKPFIVDGRTYVPLRAISELFDNEVGWDGVNYRIDLYDRSEEDLIRMSQQLFEATERIRQLEAELETSKRDDIGDLESYLNKWHGTGTYKNIEFDISLDKSKDDIYVDIYIDSDYDCREWNKLSTSNKEDYLQGIVDDILHDYKNVDIEGSIIDWSKGRKNTLDTFYTKSKGTVYIDTDYSRDDDLDDLEYYLNNSKYNRYYNDYYGGYEYADIDLYGDEDDIEIYITIPGYVEDYYDIEEYLEDLYSEITEEFWGADVDGYIKDDYTEYYFDFDRWGDVYLR